MSLQSIAIKLVTLFGNIPAKRHVTYQVLLYNETKREKYVFDNILASVFHKPIRGVQIGGGHEHARHVLN